MGSNTLALCKFLVGLNDNLFLSNDTNGVLNQTTGRAQISDELLWRISTAHAQRRRFCESIGASYMHVIVPNKETALRSLLPPPFVYEEGGPTPANRYVRDFAPQAHTFFDIAAVETCDNSLYFKTDTHWNDLGALTYLRALLDHVGQDQDTRRLAALSLSSATSEWTGDLAAHASLGPEPYTSIKVEAPRSQIVFEGSIPNEGYIRHQQWPDRPDNGRALILHDSFTYRNFPFLSEMFPDALFVHSPDCDFRLLAIWRPKVVWFFQAERFLPRIPTNELRIVDWLSHQEEAKDKAQTGSAYIRNLIDGFGVCRARLLSRHKYDNTRESATTPSSRNKTYEVVSIADLANGTKGSADISAVTRDPCLPPLSVSIPPISFGQVAKPQFDFNDFPAGTWDEAEYYVYDGFVYTIKDAVVHGEIGVVTVGDFLIRETLYLVFPEAWGMKWIDDYHIEMPTIESRLSVDVGAHVLCGAAGNRNYGHWWSNVIPALLIPPFAGTFSGSTLLMPRVRTEWQRATLNLIPEVRGRSLFLGEGISVQCGELKIVPRITWSDYTPHPLRLNLYSELKRRVGAKKGKSGRKLFISRADSTVRKLVNEAELAELASGHGFEIIVLGALSVSDQIRLFAEASHIVAAHGAGLANVVFASPGTVLCELHKETTVQWSIRRQAAIIGLKYGCLIGRDVLQDDDAALQIHDRSWHLPVEDLRDVLDREPFI
jgi:hypothetical protein